MNVYIRMAYRLWSNNGCLPTEDPVVVQFKRLDVSASLQYVPESNGPNTSEGMNLPARASRQRIKAAFLCVLHIGYQIKGRFSYLKDPDLKWVFLPQMV